MKVKLENLILKSEIYWTLKKPLKASFKSNQKINSLNLRKKICRLNNHKFLEMKYKKKTKITIQRKLFKNKIKSQFQSNLTQNNGKAGINNEFLRIARLWFSNSKQYLTKNYPLIKLKRNKPIPIAKMKNKCCREYFWNSKILKKIQSPS